MEQANRAHTRALGEAAMGGALETIYAAQWHARPTACALVDPQGVTLTYAELHERVQASADWLAAQGVSRGDRIAVWLINQSEWLVLFFALARLGATLVAVNTRFRSHELHYILSRSQASMLIMQPGFRKLDFPAIVADVDASTLTDLRCVVVLPSEGDAPAAHEATAAHTTPQACAPAGANSATILDRPVVRYAPVAATQAPPPAGTDEANDASDLADLPVILFTTSGTTKGPKLVVHTQRTMSAHSHNVARAFQMGEADDNLLAALPFCGVFGLNSVLGAMAAGQPVIMLDVFNAQDAIDGLLAHRSTHFFATDEMLRRMADAWPQGRRASLKRVGFAAFSPGSENLAETLGEMGFPLVGVYGSSEVMALFSHQSPTLPLAQRSLGGGTTSSRDAIVRIRHPETGELCAPGEAGEIEIASPTNFVGYLNNPQATRDAILPDGFFRTGDLGYLRHDDSFVYLSRMGDAMRLGGFLVNPTEIEYAITLIEGINDAQVVAVEMAGKLRPVAFVLADAHAPAAEEIIQRLSQSLAPFKVPARIWVVDAFPTTASANGLKFQRVKLRDMALARLQAEQA